MNQSGNTPSSASEASLMSRSVAETQRLGSLLGELLAPGDVILLHGALGAGKTAFTQGIARGLGVTSTVNSPTFTLLKEYAGRLKLYHFDLYRIESPDEVSALGFEEYFGGDGVSVVEWAERGEDATGPAGSNDIPSPWPTGWLRIRFALGGARGAARRELQCSALGARSQTLLAAFMQAAQAPAARHHQKERSHAAGD